MSLGGCMNKVS